MKPTLIILCLATSVILSLGTQATFAQSQSEEKTKLLEPYTPKPSGPTPEGWDIQILKGSSIETKTVLKNGREIKVNAPAYELVPKTGATTLKDPGFEPKLANAQKATVGALLTQYSETASNLQVALEKTLQELDKSLGEIVPEKAEKTPVPTGNGTAGAAATNGTSGTAPTKEEKKPAKK